jgi:hypothetical protein
MKHATLAKFTGFTGEGRRPDHSPREDGAGIMKMKQAASDYSPASTLRSRESPAIAGAPGWSGHER